MKILHLLEATGGGTRRHILDLMPAQARCGFDCTLIASPLRDAHWARDKAFLEARGVRIFEVPMQRAFSPRADAIALREIAFLWKKLRPDAVHCHSTKAGFLGRLARLVFPRAPLVYTPHCLAFDTALPSTQRRAALLLEKTLAPLTTHFIAVSRREQRVIGRARLALSTQVSHIANGIDLLAFDALAPAHRAAFDFAENEFLIGCFGRLSPQKNQRALLHAWPQFLSTQDAHLMLVGGGEEEAELREMASQLNIASRVHFLGESNEPRPLYALCDVIMQPSRWEGCPYSVLEAMASARPVVATRVGGLTEMLGAEGGVLLRDDAPKTLAAALRVLSADENRRAFLGTNARRRIETDFTLEKMLAKTNAVYEKVVSR